MLKNLTNFASLLRNAGQFSVKAKELKTSLQQRRVLGTADEGRVTVQLNGLGQMQTITISPELIHIEQHGHLELQIQFAVNQALSEARQLHIQAIRELAGGMDFPGMEDLLSDFSN